MLVTKAPSGSRAVRVWLNERGLRIQVVEAHRESSNAQMDQLWLMAEIENQVRGLVTSEVKIW